MLTKNEITALNLSPTKKDFVQIWNELLEVAGKLSERWDPTSTNESDPGIVILKALAGIADKLNYTIDKNILEAFMPTAAQEESMRKLCDMLGYNVKYYRSAETTVTIKYHNPDLTANTDEYNALQTGLEIPKFTVITNGDQDINYFIVDTPEYPAPGNISITTPAVTFHCMEGQIVKCESTSDNNVITIGQISDNNRFYLPEYQIAENGIFVYNVANEYGQVTDGEVWEKVDNLNIQERGTRIFKFGYDSYEGRPYLEFPEDYSELINDGLFIYYARTSGASGNVSVRTLSQLELPRGGDWDKVSVESFSVENTFAATTGSDIETISQAYNNFKKTIGTFETLVTCRDYMNKIYSLTDAATGKPLVSNALVTDIRTDLNRAITICSCDDAGIFYKDVPLTETTTKKLKLTGGTDFVEVDVEEDLIDHFDLVLYPFKSYNQIKNNVKDIQTVYDKCFEYNPQSGVETLLAKSDVKTIAHNIITPRAHNIVSINNYLKLNAIIGTTSKITTEESTFLIDKIKIALANAFNMRELDFGDEIPFESILSVIENADSRISIVSLAEPALYTTFSVYEGMLNKTPIIREYAVASDWLTENYADTSNRFEYTTKTTTADGDTQYDYSYTFDVAEAKEIYNKLAIRNVLAGRVPLFKYNTTFEPSFSDGAYRVTSNIKQSDLPKALASSINSDGVNTFTPSANNPVTIQMLGDKVYTGVYADVAVEAIPAEITWKDPENNSPVLSVEYTDPITNETVTYLGTPDEDGEATAPYAKITYSETATPDKYADNFITKDSSDDDKYTELEAVCQIFPDRVATEENPEGEPTNCISNVTLAEGEFIRFRAPNFITDKTYPAYVNYHLALNNKQLTEAKPASAISLHDLLTAQTEESEAWRARVTDFFDNSYSSLKKTVTITQTIAAKKPETTKPDKEVTILLSEADKPNAETWESIFNKSGFIRIINKTATIKFVDTDEKPTIDIPPLPLTYQDPNYKEHSTSYILTAKDISKITNHVDSIIEAAAKAETNTLPEAAWTISYIFEYIPFDAVTLNAWEVFIRNSGKDSNANNADGYLSFNPISGHGAILWRSYPGTYLDVGEDVLLVGDSHVKLLPFYSSHFGVLNEQRLSSIYVVNSRGSDVVPNFIRNNEEYELRPGESLFIEYTPSSATEDSTTQSQKPKTEVFGAGTIIKPSGFEDPGLKDSTVLKQTKTSNKTIEEIDLFSLGVNEQIAIRERAEVSLTPDKFSNSPVIYVYKNFNNCPNLEDYQKDRQTGLRINNSYTLQDGEYILYTDQYQSEFAYYSSGTEVTLTGDLCLDKYEIIDIATIFENGIKEIPWGQPITLSKEDTIKFQEFQYITLGPNDTLQSLYLNQNEDSEAYLDSKWRSCTDAAYTVAGSDELVVLPKINLDAGPGWEVSSILELNASASTAQTLRSTDKVKTSVTLYKTPTISALGTREAVVKLEAADADHPLSFKANLPCLSSNGTLKIDDIYNNPNNIKSLELKLTTQQPPAVIRTARNKLIPYVPAEDDTASSTTTYTARTNSTSTSTTANIPDMTQWLNDAQKTFATKGYGELWTRIPLNYLARDTIDAPYDNALKLSISVLPETYGIFSIYLKYEANTIENANADISSLNACLYLLPGSTTDDITVLNCTAEELAEKDPDKQIIYLDPITNGVVVRLRAGLNCIRVNRTCDLFIKATADDSAFDSLITSTLYLDDLRLVDCRPVEYIQNGELKRTQQTQGLNLAQIGYLNSDELNQLNAFDMQIRKKAKEDYTKTTLAALENRAKQEESARQGYINSLYEVEPDLRNLYSFAKNVVEELQRLQELYTIESTSENSTDDQPEYSADQKLIKLIDFYNELSTDLVQENDLLQSLEDNSNINNIEKQLKDLFVEVSNNEAVRAELHGKLETLDFIAMQQAGSFTATNLPKWAILDDFEAVAAGLPTSATSDTGELTDSEQQLLDLFAEVVNDLKLFSIKRVNTEYTAKLAALTANLGQLNDTEIQATVEELLNTLGVTKHTKLLTQIEQLTNTKYAVINNLITNATQLVYNDASGNITVDYVALRVALISLQEYLLSANFAELLDVISAIKDSAMSHSDMYTELNSRITSFLLKLNAGTEKYTSLQTDVTSLLNQVQNIIDFGSTTNDAQNINNSLTQLSTTASSIYTEALKTDLTSILDTLQALESTYSTYMEELSEANNELLPSILNNLEVYRAARTDKLLDINNFDGQALNETYLDIPYGTNAVLTLWPEYMKRDYIKGVGALYRDIRLAIANPANFETLSIDACFYANSAHTVLRSALTDAANLTEYQQLFTLAKEQQATENQNSTRANLINVIATQIVPSSTLAERLRAIADDTDNYANRNVVLQQIITNWLAPTTSIIEKQNLLAKLQKELAEVIRIDTQLVEILSNLISPSILLFNPDNYDPAFYGAWSDKVESAKAVLTGSTANTILDNLATLLGSDVAEFDVTDLDSSETDFIYGFIYIEKVINDLLTAVKAEDFSTFITNNYEITEVCLPDKVAIAVGNCIDSFAINTDIANIKSSKLISLLQQNLVVAWEIAYKETTDATTTYYNWLDASGKYYRKYINNAWVAYPVDGTALDQTTWLKTAGEHVDVEGYWCQADGRKVHVTAKRSYAANAWLDAQNNIISVKTADNEWLPADTGAASFVIMDESLRYLLENPELVDNPKVTPGLLDYVIQLGSLDYAADEAKETYSTAVLEKKLLQDIRNLDKNRDFYYNVPIEANVAINFNEGEPKLNTLMNPAVNYDINNVNNNFVISKIDINYLNNGLKIARSSKLG